MNKTGSTQNPIVPHRTAFLPNPGSTPQTVALFIAEEYKLNQNTVTPDLCKFLVGIGVFNAKVHPVRRGFFVEFVFQGLKISTNVQYACTYQVHKSSPRTRKSVDNVW